MNEHPIEGLMSAAMNSIREMIDVNTIIGDPIETPNGTIIIPISKVGLGFAAGGSEFTGETLDEYTKKNKDEEIQYKLPFGGGSGAGISITPVAFLIVQGDNVKLIHVNNNSAIDRLLDYVPDLLEKANNMMDKKIGCNCNEKKDTNIENQETNKNVEPFKIHPKINKQIKNEYINKENSDVESEKEKE